MATVVHQAQQEACDRDLDATVRHYNDPGVPPCYFKEHGEKIWTDVGEVLGMSPDAVPCKNHEQ